MSKRNKPGSNGNRSTKQSISSESNYQEIPLVVVDYVSRKILTVDSVIKLSIYFLAVAVASIISDVSRPGAFYFSTKHNFLNQYFVKLGWGWTFIFVGALMLLSNLISNRGEIKHVGGPVARLTIMTIYWYVCTNGFEWLEDFTGSCTNASLSSKRRCLRDGSNWLGFDISGHAFLLVHCLLFINEESQVILSLSKSLDQLFKSEAKSTKPNPISLAATYRVQLRIITLVLVCFTFLWEFMLFITAVYYHTTVQKIVGMVVGLGGWSLVYKILKFSVKPTNI